MPITIVGNNFQKEWDERERTRIVISIQKAMIDEHLGLDDMLLLFAYHGGAKLDEEP